MFVRVRTCPKMSAGCPLHAHPALRERLRAGLHGGAAARARGAYEDGTENQAGDQTADVIIEGDLWVDDREHEVDGDHEDPLADHRAGGWPEYTTAHPDERAKRAEDAEDGTGGA